MLDPRLLARLEPKKATLDALRPRPAAAVARLDEQITEELIYNSNAIEGSTLTMRETQRILETGLTIDGKSLREIFEVINHRDAIEYVESLSGQDSLLTAFHVRQTHRVDREWISLVQAAEGTPYSQEYLSLLARKGRLEAIKRGRVWLTTRQAVADYRVSIAEKNL